MPHSVLDAIKDGVWDFEPEEPKESDESQYVATRALPGSHEKVEVLAARLAQGLPLWHPQDRRSFNDTEGD